MPSESVSVVCPNCQAQLKAGQNRLGKVVNCPACDEPFQVNSPSSRATELAGNSAVPVAEARRQSDTDLGDSLESSTTDEGTYQLAAPKSSRFCPHCGQKLLASETTCRVCLAAANPATFSSNKCSSCGGILSAGRIVCPKCHTDNAVETKPGSPVLPPQKKRRNRPTAETLNHESGDSEQPAKPILSEEEQWELLRTEDKQTPLWVAALALGAVVMVIAAAVVFGTGMFSGFWTRLGVSLGFGVGVALIGLLFQGVQSFYEAIQDKSENVLTVVNAIFVSYVVVLGLLYFWFSWTHDLDLGEELTLISVLLFGIGVGKHFRSRVGTFIGQTSDVPDEVQPKPDHHKAGEG